MEASDLLSVLAAIAAFGCGLLVVVACAARSRKTAASYAGRDTRTNFLVRRLRYGVGPVKPFARVLLRINRIQTLVAEAAWACSLRDITTTEEALLSSALAAIGCISIVAGFVTLSPVGGLAVAACLIACAVAWIGTQRDKHREELREAVPDALRSMGVCFQSGLSLLQTFQQVSQETDGRLSTVFAQASRRLEIGQSANEALGVLQRAATVPELKFVAVALDVQHQAGGSMKRVLDSARDTVESQIELRRSLRVQTAQARLSTRVVSVMPFVLIALFSLISEGFLDPFFESALGLAVLGTALGMQAIGILVVRRMLKVEVD